MGSERTSRWVRPVVGWLLFGWVLIHAVFIPTPLQRAHALGRVCADAMFGLPPLVGSGQDCDVCGELDGIRACEPTRRGVALDVEPGGLWFGVLPAWNYHIVFELPNGAAAGERLLGVSSSEAIGW